MDNFGRRRGEADPDATGVIRVGAKPGPEAEEARRFFALTLFFRLAALLWILQALEQWRRIIAPATGSFADFSASVMAATVFFAVLNPIAAVGLWLMAPWGGVVWLLTLIAQAFVASSKPSFFMLGGYTKVVDVVLLGLYLFLSWRAGGVSAEPSGIDRLIARLRELTDGFQRKR
ncbi:hypothetical protein [Rhodoblastus sp.]|jgi:hypothetical protein|uniref:hypothetical protein n=1 Tax=Rhodoblastus sp. TaxID=1962975 RepID=UPI00262B63E3|nr:hypothetical protein [Rhodoblastus sp.]